MAAKKMLVETVGSIMLVNPMTGCVVPHNRPSVVLNNSWVQNQVAPLDHLKVLVKDVPEDRTDEDFVKYWIECKGNPELAISSFMSKKEDEDAGAKQKRATELRSKASAAVEASAKAPTNAKLKEEADKAVAAADEAEKAARPA